MLKIEARATEANKQNKVASSMTRLCKVCNLIAIYLISPAAFLVSKYKIDKANVMLFRMTVNTTYYTAIVAIIFITINL
jgi:hypothetical protein